jgi:O-antigen/teichoic acid export membrane protein
MSETLGTKTVRGVIWSCVERFSMQCIHFLVTLILARLLTPNDFGLTGMLVVFIALSQTLIDGGFSMALIRKLDRTETDNSTVFYFNIVTSIFVYFLLYATAPLVAIFFHEMQLIEIMRVLSIGVVFNSFSVIQRVLYTAKVNFKVQAKATTIAAFLSGVVGIISAYKGAGVWALVYQYVSSTLFNTVLLWYYCSWRPILVFSWKSFRELYLFGFNLTLVGIIETLYQNSYQIFIGKFFSAASLGYFTQAKTIANFPSTNISGIIGRVTYPIMSDMQDDNERLSEIHCRLARIIAFGVFPMMCGLAALSFPVIEVLIGSKWHFAAILMMPLSFSFMFHPIHAINMNVLQVKGKSKLYLKSEIIKKIISVAILISTIPFGIIVMCYGRIISSVLTLLVNMFYTSKQMEVGLFTLIKDLIPSLGLSLIMFCVVKWITAGIGNAYIQLCVGITVGILLYVGGAYLLKIRELNYVYLLSKKLNYGTKRFY